MYLFVRKQQTYLLLLWVLMAIAFISRVINLNYNSPFNDEAIYIVVGRFGIFQWDWTTYGATSWMAGLPFIYPSLAALAQVTGGVAGSRFLNVILGVLALELIFLISYFLSAGQVKQKAIAGLIAAGLVGGSAVSFYVSRLATYDMPSFYLLLFSIALMLYANALKENQGKWYFLSSIALLLSVATKIITGIYVPLVVGYSFITAYKNGSEHFALWKKYFVIPLIAGFLIYIVKYMSDLRVFFNTQIIRDYAEFGRVLSVYLENTTYIWLFWFLGVAGLLFSKRYIILLYLTVCTFWVVVFHFFTHRVPTFDKHIYLSYVFLAITSGLGIAEFINKIEKKKILKTLVIFNMVGFLILFWGRSFFDAQRFNRQWENSSNVLSALSSQVENDDKILTEIGASTILSVYDKDYPTNVTTFDWIEYKGVTGDPGYIKAIKEGYFKFVVLASQNQGKDDGSRNLHEQLVENMGKNYHLVYEDGKFFIYKKQPTNYYSSLN